MTTYVDASVVMRIVLGEPDPLPDWHAITPVSSELVRVECLRVLEHARIRLRLDDAQSARYRGDVLELLRTFALAPVSESILERAGDPFPTSLGTLDAIHLATALELGAEFADLRLATHDRELAQAARAMGVDVIGA